MYSRRVYSHEYYMFMNVYVYVYKTNIYVHAPCIYSEAWPRQRFLQTPKVSFRALTQSAFLLANLNHWTISTSIISCDMIYQTLLL